MSTYRALAAAALIALSLAGSVSHGMAQGCISDAEFRQLVQQGQVVTLPEAMQRAGVSGQVIDAQLCPAGGGYVYRVRVRQDGQVTSHQFPAG